MDIKDVEKLADMARIELGEDEKKELLADMQSILGYVKIINAIETKDVKIKYDIHNIWREDDITPRDFSSEIIIDQFPNKKDNFLKVKKIL